MAAATLSKGTSSIKVLIVGGHIGSVAGSVLLNSTSQDEPIPSRDFARQRTVAPGPAGSGLHRSGHRTGATSPGGVTQRAQGASVTDRE